MSRPNHKPNYKSISYKMVDKNLENWILTKSNNYDSCKSKSSMTKLELDLYWVKSNSFTNIKRYCYLDVYTILIRISLTILTICAFLVLTPCQWSLARTMYIYVIFVYTHYCSNPIQCIFYHLIQCSNDSNV